MFGPRPSTSGRDLSARWRLLAAVLFVGGCGGERELLPPIHERLVVRPVETTDHLPETKVWRRFDVLRERPDWEIRAVKSNVRAVTFEGEPASILWLSGAIGDPPGMEVRIPGTFTASEFNDIQATVLVPAGEFRLTASLVRRGEVLVTSDPIELATRRQPQVVAVPVPEAQQQEDPYDNIAITFLGEGPRAGILSVLLRDRPLRSFLPAPDKPPALVSVEGEWRAAVGLSSRRPLETHLLVPERSQVRLHFARPPALDDHYRKDSLRIAITDEAGAETVHRIDLGPQTEAQVSERPILLPRYLLRGKARFRKRKAEAKLRPKKWRNKLAPVAFGEEDEGAFASATEEAPETLEPLPPSPWTEVLLPLDELSGQRATLRFELADWPEVETVCALTPPVIVRPAMQPATVLLVTVSGLRADHLGVSGSGVEIDTDLLDRLANRGAWFEDCYAPSNDSRTSLQALMSGAWPPGEPLEDPPVTLAKRFRQAGFATWAVLANSQLNPDTAAAALGFDRVIAPRQGERDAADVVHRLIAGVDEERGFPLFVWLQLGDPEEPYTPPDNFLFEYFDPESDPYAEDLLELPEPLRPKWDPDVRDPAWPTAQYKSEVTYTDRHFREILEHPRLGHGIIAVTADHAENLAAHAVWFSHEQLYPDTLAVPLILDYPGVQSGRRVQRPVSIVDLGRTLLDLAGAGDRPFPGTNLLLPPTRPTPAGAPVPTDGASAEVAGIERPRAAPRFAFSPGNGSVAVQADSWFFVLSFDEVENPEEESGASQPEFTHAARLFDLAEDPGCERNVLADHPQVAAGLFDSLVEWMSDPATKTLYLPPVPPKDCRCDSCSIFR